MEAINPFTGETIRAYATHDANQVQELIERADACFREWRKTDLAHRSARLHAAAEVLRKNSERYAQLMTDEMGKPIAQSRAEVEKCAWVCDYYADEAGNILAREDAPTEASNSFVSFQPIGTVLAVMPWNFPFWQVFRFAAPALMAGNVGLLKHASNVPGCALAIEEVFREAGCPAGAFTTLMIGSRMVDQVLEHPKVMAATLTGSTPAGQAVASKCGSLIKKTVLELGGSDPYVVLEDADLDATAASCATSRMINGGQSCIAAKRFIVVDEVYDAFVERFVEQMRAYPHSDPNDDSCKLGPMARADLRLELHEQVQKSVAAGAKCVLGGEIPDGPGAFYPATVLIDVEDGQLAYREEIFGPVAAVIRAKDEQDAIRIANDSEFGLGAAVFTQDKARGERIAEQELEAGACFVNSFVKSDPRLPFGGVKISGYGRELAAFGLREFVNIKAVYVA